MLAERIRYMFKEFLFPEGLISFTFKGIWNDTALIPALFNDPVKGLPFFYS